jgi:hypothetical protein
MSHRITHDKLTKQQNNNFAIYPQQNEALSVMISSIRSSNHSAQEHEVNPSILDIDRINARQQQQSVQD